MYNPDFLEQAEKTRDIDLGNGPLTVQALEVFLEVLARCGECRLRNVGSISLLELGAALGRLTQTVETGDNFRVITQDGMDLGTGNFLRFIDPKV